MSPLQGMSPVIRMNKMTPTAQKSDSGPGWPTSDSGAIYPGVPAKRAFFGVLGVQGWHVSKSMSFTVLLVWGDLPFSNFTPPLFLPEPTSFGLLELVHSSLQNIMFSGFTSR